MSWRETPQVKWVLFICRWIHFQPPPRCHWAVRFDSVHVVSFVGYGSARVLSWGPRTHWKQIKSRDTERIGTWDGIDESPVSEGAISEGAAIKVEDKGVCELRPPSRLWEGHVAMKSRWISHPKRTSSLSGAGRIFNNISHINTWEETVFLGRHSLALD